MPITEPNPPRDTGGQALSKLEITRRKIVERMPGFLKSQEMRELHKKRRTLELARQMHQCGAAVLPLPSFVAFIEIDRLEFDESRPFEYVAEAIFILSNQERQDVLFLTGIARRRAILEACKNIHAHNAGDYLVCIKEMINEAKKALLLGDGDAEGSGELDTTDQLIALSETFGQPPRHFLIDIPLVHLIEYFISLANIARARKAALEKSHRNKAPI